MSTNKHPVLALALAKSSHLTAGINQAQGNEAFPGSFRLFFYPNHRIAARRRKKHQTQMHPCSEGAGGGPGLARNPVPLTVTSWAEF